MIFEIQELSAALSDESLSPADVGAIFVQLGITDVTSVYFLLKLGADLHPHFLEISDVLPGVREASQRFVKSAHLFENLSRNHASLSNRFPTIDVPLPLHADELVAQTYLRVLINNLAIDDQPMADARHASFAVAWLLLSLQHWTPKCSAALSAKDPQSYSLPAGWDSVICEYVLLTAKSTSVTEQLNDVLHNHHGIADDRILGFMHAVSCRQIVSESLPTENDACDDSDDFEMTGPCRRDADPNARRAPASWAHISSRAKLPHHYAALAKDKQNILFRAIRLALDGSDGAGQTEATLAALSILTCKTVNELLGTAIDPDADEALCIFTKYWEPWPRTNHRLREKPWLAWRRRLSKTAAPLMILMPNWIAMPALTLFQRRTTGTVSTYLLASSKSWEDRTYAWVASKIGGTPTALARKLKHLLPRELHSKGANSAVLDAFTRELSHANTFRRRETLSFYLPHSNPMVHESFMQTTIALFGAYGPKLNITKLQDGENLKFPVEKRSHIPIHTFFKRKIEQAREADDWREHHNWFSMYCLLLLIAATGHRYSRTPFFFRHDILIEENLAFICDKNITGSEVRFVPISELVLKQLEHYLLHLASISDRLTALAPQDTIASRQQNSTSRKSLQPDQPASFWKFSSGFFFSLSSDWKQTCIGMQELKNACQPEFNVDMRLFRSELLTALWEEGCTGLEIDAMAGHNAELHVFGDASTWTVRDWAAGVRPKIDRYLRSRGWPLVEHWSRGEAANESPLNACFRVSFLPTNSSYEGRKRSAIEATRRADQAINGVLTSEYLEENNWNLSAADTSAVRREIDAKLAGDEDALKKVRASLAKRLGKLSHAFEINQTASYNLIRTEPGPIDVLFSRYFAIAANFRARAIKELIRPMSDRGASIAFTNSLAHIAISLVLYDAVLDETHLNAYLLRIAQKEFYRIDGQILVRAEISSQNHVFEKAVLLSSITALQVYSFHKFDDDKSATGVQLQEVWKQVDDLVSRLAGNQVGRDFKLKDLIDVQKAWWFIRLPGSLYSIATGRTRGPALSIRSEMAFFCDIPPIKTAILGLSDEQQGNMPVAIPGTEKVEAGRMIERILSDARGSFRAGEGASKAQRQRLRAYFNNAFKGSSLDRLRGFYPIVGYFCNFLLYLLEEGGKRERYLAFETISSYMHTLLKGLMPIAWDEDFTSYDVKTFQTLYNDFLARGTPKENRRTPLCLFHRFLQYSIDAPYVPGLHIGKTVPQRIRTIIITPMQFDQAWRAIAVAKAPLVQQSQHTAHLLGCMYGFAMRPREALGLTTNAISFGEQPAIYIGNNRFRAVKSKAPRSVYTTTLPSAARNLLFADFRRLIVLKSDAAIFEDRESPALLYPVQRILDRLTAHLRDVTSDTSIVPYCLRHTAATILATCAVQETGYSAASHVVHRTLTRDVNAKSLQGELVHDAGPYPFMMELVAMVLGHESVGTTLGNYWHTSHFALGAFTEREASHLDVNGQALASFLGVSTARISQKYKVLRLAAANGEEQVGYRSMISDFISKSTIVTVAQTCLSVETEDGDGNAGARSRSPIVDVDVSDKVPDGFALPTEWRIYDRILLERQHNQTTLGQAAFEATTKYGLSKAQMERFFTAYQSIVRETCFDDFEPVNSELLTGPPKRAAGVRRGRKERETLISRAQQAVNSGPVQSNVFQLLCSRWLTLVNCDEPYVIATSVTEAHTFIDFLGELKAFPDQFALTIVSFEHAEVESLRQRTHHGDVLFRDKGVSRGSGRLKVREVGINVRQASGANLPDGRDLHRALFVLSVITRAVLLNS